MSQSLLPYDRRLALLRTLTSGQSYPYVQDWAHPIRSIDVNRQAFHYPFVCVPFPETDRLVWVFHTAQARARFVDMYIAPYLEGHYAHTR